MGQSPGNLEVAGAGQNVVQHAGLSLCEGSVAGIGIINDGLCGVDQIGELLVAGHQILLPVSGAGLHDLGDVGVVPAVVGVVVVQDLLTNEVDGIAEVSAPAVDNEALQLRIADFLSEGRNKGLDVQHDEVIAEAVGEALLQHGCVVQSGGVGGDDVVSSVDREGNADGAQLVHGLLLQVSDVAVVGAQTLHGLAIILLAVQTQLLSDQAGVIGAMGGVIGSLQAMEAIKYITGVGKLLTGYLLTYDAINQEFHKIKLPSNTDGCAVCGSHPTITELIDYEQVECTDK